MYNSNDLSKHISAGYGYIPKKKNGKLKKYNIFKDRKPTQKGYHKGCFSGSGISN